MKFIKYFMRGSGVEIGYSEANLAIAQMEADNGEYEIIDDGQVVEVEKEPSAQDDTDAMLIDHEYRLTMLELGLTE